MSRSQQQTSTPAPRVFSAKAQRKSSDLHSSANSHRLKPAKYSTSAQSSSLISLPVVAEHNNNFQADIRPPLVDNLSPVAALSDEVDDLDERASPAAAAAASVSFLAVSTALISLASNEHHPIEESNVLPMHAHLADTMTTGQFSSSATAAVPSVASDLNPDGLPPESTNSHTLVITGVQLPMHRTRPQSRQHHSKDVTAHQDQQPYHVSKPCANSHVQQIVSQNSLNTEPKPISRSTLTVDGRSAVPSALVVPSTEPTSLLDLSPKPTLTVAPYGGGAKPSAPAVPSEPAVSLSQQHFPSNLQIIPLSWLQISCDNQYLQLSSPLDRYYGFEKAKAVTSLHVKQLLLSNAVIPVDPSSLSKCDIRKAISIEQIAKLKPCLVISDPQQPTPSFKSSSANSVSVATSALLRLSYTSACPHGCMSDDKDTLLLLDSHMVFPFLTERPEFCGYVHYNDNDDDTIIVRLNKAIACLYVDNSETLSVNSDTYRPERYSFTNCPTFSVEDDSPRPAVSEHPVQSIPARKRSTKSRAP